MCLVLLQDVVVILTSRRTILASGSSHPRRLQSGVDRGVWEVTNRSLTSEWKLGHA